MMLDDSWPEKPTSENPTIETVCAGCGRVLRVPSAHAGKQARCPVCGNISVVPGNSAAGNGNDVARLALDPHRPVASDEWSMRTPEGQIYGPIPRSELDRWVADGRVTAECELHHGRLEADAAETWLAADNLYPQLRPVAWTPPQRAHAGSLAGTATGAPFAASLPRNDAVAFAAERLPATYQAPHRGGLVMVLGILGLFVGCPIFSLMAWVMGSSDLREMRAGRMDRSGEGLTQVGQILGALISILWIGAFVLIAFILLVAAANGG